MICARSWSNSIHKLRERLISKIADASFVLWRFVSLTGKPASAQRQQCGRSPRRLQPQLGDVRSPSDSADRIVCITRLQASSSFATEKSFTNESISEWK